MNKLFLCCLTLVALETTAQKTPTELARPVVEEGKRLYKSEMASWYGTDVFLEHKKQEDIGGYFSYLNNQTPICIFFSKAENPKVIGTITFDSTYNTKTAGIDLKERAFTDFEIQLYTIRKAAYHEIKTDTLFKSYKNTNFNLIPLIYGGEKKVYVLTGTSQQGVVIFGNDYLLNFDKDNNLTRKKRIHQSIISVNTKHEGKEGEKSVGAMHTHLPETGEFMTATDICTLMLYQKFTNWEQHNVVSEKYLSIWTCSTNQLTVIPMDVVEKINKDSEKRNKKQ